jgi:hypothetical protein
MNVVSVDELSKDLLISKNKIINFFNNHKNDLLVFGKHYIQESNGEIMFTNSGALLIAAAYEK